MSTTLNLFWGLANRGYVPPMKYKCEKCDVYTAGIDKCTNCGAKRTGQEKRL